MNIPSDIRKLAQLLQKYGAPDPEGWARSQINEGIPQLQRFLFLRQAWRNVLEENDVTWIDRQVASPGATGTAPTPASVRRLSGASTRESLLRT